MPSTSTGISSIDATTAALQAELPQLEQLQQDLEKELAAVSDRVLSVRAALTALLALADTPAPRTVQEQVQEQEAEPKSEPSQAQAPAPTPAPTPPPTPTESEAAVEAASDTVKPEESGSVPAPRKATASRSTRERKAPPRARRGKERPSAKKPRVSATPQEAPSAPQGSTGLTEQVAAVLTQSPDSPMRARDVAKALGRDSSTGAINTVRSTLDRLVATSRADRAGRGLYQAPAR
ncbi:outer membrane biosynthesis protein TonB [Streptomyces sp. PvR006]|uniref:hypothetical protein n=1 Tax=Streptomyces sp. PvR006 TaxID=2817860 RepID=UPI001AE6214D|nr:hypothetical protein [Streptomyces sp. PvR006]MBP2579855.1 outer membrane biosynthesis protein TonB [Streptomyces sp. PvR006]